MHCNRKRQTHVRTNRRGVWTSGSVGPLHSLESSEVLAWGRTAAGSGAPGSRPAQHTAESAGVGIGRVSRWSALRFAPVLGTSLARKSRRQIAQPSANVQVQRGPLAPERRVAPMACAPQRLLP